VIRRKLFGLSFATLSLAAGGALAQTGGRGKGRDRGGDKAGAREPANMLEVTLHEFHEDLKLSPAQEPAWLAYEDKLRALEADIARERRQSAQMGVLLRIDRAVDVARDRLTAVEDIAIAAKTLYGRLSPEQQETADPRLANLISLPFGFGTAAGAGAERAPRSRGPVSN